MTSARESPLLIVYGEIDLFMLELQDAFDRAGAETLIARTPTDALGYLKRFDFAAVLINYTPAFATEDFRKLLAELGRIPALLLADALTPMSVVATLPTLLKSTQPDAVVRAVERLLSK